MASKRIKLICHDNGVGLTRDGAIIRDLLESRGYPVEMADPHVGPSRPQEMGFDLAIHVEIVAGLHYKSARKHVLVPNQEWFIWPHVSGRFTRVLCKTHHAQKLFDRIGFPTCYTSFTSRDRYDGSVPRERVFLHVAGKSRLKNTNAVVEAWKAHPEWPLLYVVNQYEDLKLEVPNISYHYGEMPDDELRLLQNRARYHIIPSAAEGFGHVLWEAMSVGAALITTDAPPMNEVPGFHIAATPTARHGLDRLSKVTPEGVAERVGEVLEIDDGALEALARGELALFTVNYLFFRKTFVEAIEEALND